MTPDAGQQQANELLDASFSKMCPQQILQQREKTL